MLSPQDIASRLLELSDEELVVEYQSTSDSRTIAILYDRYLHLVFGMCLKYLEDREDAEDLSMTVFEKMIVRLPDENVNNFKSWLYSVIRNECIDHLRKRHSEQEKVKKMTYGEKSEEKFMENEGVLRLINEDQTKIEPLTMARAMQTLPLPQQECLTLFYLESKSYKDIAAQTGMTLKQVKSHLQNGKRKLKKLLQQE